jgi:hypothetical protein
MEIEFNINFDIYYFLTNDTQSLRNLEKKYEDVTIVISYSHYKACMVLIHKIKSLLTVEMH